MIARVTTYQDIDLALTDRLQAWVEGPGADMFDGLPGYHGSITLVDRDNLRLIGIGFYESAGHAAEAEALMAAPPPEAVARIPAELQGALAMRPETTGLYDVAHRDDQR